MAPRRRTERSIPPSLTAFLFQSGCRCKLFVLSPTLRTCPSAPPTARLVSAINFSAINFIFLLRSTGGPLVGIGQIRVFGVSSHNLSRTRTTGQERTLQLAKR